MQSQGGCIRETARPRMRSVADFVSIDRMMWTVAALLIGSVGSAVRNRSAAAAIAGLALTMAMCCGFSGMPPVWSSPDSPIRRAGLLAAGILSALFAAPGPDVRHAFPLDLRLGAAVLSGFLARGGVVLAREWWNG